MNYDRVMKDFSPAEAPDKPSKVEKSSAPSIDLGVQLLKAILILGTLGLMLMVAIKIPGSLTQPVEILTVDGLHVLKKERVAAQLELNEENSWFDLDPYTLSAKLHGLAWVDQAFVRREFPQRLHVDIVEAQPVAYLRRGSEFFLIDRSHKILKNSNPSIVWDLPILIANPSTELEEGNRLDSVPIERAFRLLEALQENPILPKESISDIDVTDPLNIKITTIPDGVILKFGYKNFKEKLKRLQSSYPVLKAHRGEYKYLDLRNYAGVVLGK